MFILGVCGDNYTNTNRYILVDDLLLVNLRNLKNIA